MQHSRQLDRPPQRLCGHGHHRLAMTAETFTGINYALIYYGLTLAILLSPP